MDLGVWAAVQQVRRGQAAAVLPGLGKPGAKREEVRVAGSEGSWEAGVETCMGEYDYAGDAGGLESWGLGDSLKTANRSEFFALKEVKNETDPE